MLQYFRVIKVAVDERKVLLDLNDCLKKRKKHCFCLDVVIEIHKFSFGHIVFLPLSKS